MKTFTGALALSASLVLVPALGRPSDDGASVETQWTQASEYAPQPETYYPPPADPPPAPPMENAAPPQYQAEAPAQQPPPPGQWVYTSQYGWVWMPYGDAYTHAPTNGADPSMFVYYPAVGWRWVVAPWVLGWGPMPYFGVSGPSRFGWYGSSPGRGYGQARWYGGGSWYGGRWSGHGTTSPVPYRVGNPVPYRSGYGAPPRAGYVAPPRPGYAAPPRPGYGAAPRAGYASPSLNGRAASRGRVAAAPRSGFASPRGGHSGGGSSAGHGEGRPRS